MLLCCRHDTNDAFSELLSPAINHMDHQSLLEGEVITEWRLFAKRNALRVNSMFISKSHTCM